MRVRQFQFQTDYEDVKSWWESHGWEPQRKETLPQIGLLAEDNGIKFCAVWLYPSPPTPMAWLEFLVTNPKSPIRQRAMAVKKILRSAGELADSSGLILFTSLKSKSLIREYSRAGFIETDTGMTNMVRVK